MHVKGSAVAFLFKDNLSHFNFPTKTPLPDQDTGADLYYAMFDVYKFFFS